MKTFELDKRLIDLLKKRGYETEEEINKFLEPSFDNLHNPFDLDGMLEAKNRIEKAIKNKEKIVIYGDYDCDGISACVILYNYFLSKNIICDVYIPNRFDDGHGLTNEMIDEVVEKSKPDLIITVDLGVTAVEEVEKVKSYNIDIIVTDHHEPSSVIPNCIVIDPKKPNQKYPFNGLCGAGVALKLVEALAGREEIKKYLDVCAIATIGDIVPLVDENRIIAKLGIEMFNSDKALKSYKYMINELNLKTINATNITFRIVPRINSSGRMSNAKKVFDFLIEKNDKKMKELYSEMVNDNENRLDSINDGAIKLDQEMLNVDLSKEKIILLKGDFHQGVLGILSSRICHEYNRPAIIFTKTDYGTLKGSGRSLDSIDLHLALENTNQYLLRYGGHKMAAGVELEESKFDDFKEAIIKEVSKQANEINETNKNEFDIVINEKDINKDFINQVLALEPFGCKNEKPVFMLESKKLNVMQMKDSNYKHFKITTPHGKSIVAFSAEKHIDILKLNVKKHLLLELENNIYKDKVYPQAILRDVYIKEVKLEEDKERECVLSLINKYKSEKQIIAVNRVNEFEIFELDKLLNRLSVNKFGTIVVVDSAQVADRIKNIIPKLKNFVVSHVPLKNRQNTILVSPRFVVEKSEIEGYNNIVFTRKIFNHEKNYFLEKANVYVVKNKSNLNFKLDNSRNVNIQVYNLLKKYKDLKANNIFEWLDKIFALEGGISKVQLLFSCLAFDELGFVKIELSPNFNIEVVDNPPKKELSSSKFMNKLAKRN